MIAQLHLVNKSFLSFGINSRIQSTKTRVNLIESSKFFIKISYPKTAFKVGLHGFKTKSAWSRACFKTSTNKEALIKKITNSTSAFHLLNQLRHSETEEFWAIALKPNKETISVIQLFKGTVDACLVHPRDIFRFACRANASSIIVAHNHPSEDPNPSHEDFALTKKLKLASEIIEIPLLDHLICTPNAFRSFADEGWLKF